jgi:hypothetical protein
MLVWRPVMTTYDTQAFIDRDASASPALGRSSPVTALLYRVVHNLAVFTLLLVLALAPLAFRLYLIAR